MKNGKLERLAVIGSGTMGHGIAQVGAQTGMDVRMYDLSEEFLTRAMEKIKGNLKRRIDKGRLSAAESEEILARIQPSIDLPEAVSNADVVVEAIPERMELKIDCFRAIDKHSPATALLASNTSSLSVTEIAAATKRPEQVVGLHFFNPVPAMKLLEIVRGLRCLDATIDQARVFAEQLGKEAIVVKDWPGFATSRLGIALGAEAIRMVEQGVSTPAEIDRAMELGYRHPMGPLRLTDLVGLDVRLAIMDHLHRELGEQFRPPALLRQMVRAGKTGRKSGEGFYRYD